MKLKDVQKTKVLGFLNESAKQSLQRVIKHIKSKNGFGIVTTFRKENDQKTNFELLDKAEKILRDAGFGFFKVRGYWFEENYETKEKRQVEEISLFVPNEKGTNLFDKLIEISKISTPNQDGFIYSDGKDIALFEMRNDKYTKTITFEKITEDTIEGLLERLKNKQIFAATTLRDRNKKVKAGYFFESFWVQPGNSIGALSFGKRGYIY